MPRTHILREMTGKNCKSNAPATIDRMGRIVDQTEVVLEQVSSLSNEKLNEVQPLTEVVKVECNKHVLEKEELEELENREDLDDDSCDICDQEPCICCKKCKASPCKCEKFTTSKTTKKKSKKNTSTKAKGKPRAYKKKTK